MPSLSEHVNVYDAAVTVLLSRGFQVWVRDDGETFWAEKDGWDFVADSPVSLLGLVAMMDHIKPVAAIDYWWRPSDLKRYKDLPTEPRPYEPVINRKRLP